MTPEEVEAAVALLDEHPPHQHHRSVATLRSSRMTIGCMREWSCMRPLESSRHSQRAGVSSTRGCGTLVGHHARGSDDTSSGCYHCEVVRPGRLWKRREIIQTGAARVSR